MPRLNEYEDAAADDAGDEPLLPYRRHSASHRPNHGKTLKRPPEPRIPINDAAIRIAELKALVAQGRAEADADNVRAGFFGGDGEHLHLSRYSSTFFCWGARSDAIYPCPGRYRFSQMGVP